MEAFEAARHTARVIVGLPAGFMMDPETYRIGGDLGFQGTDFYVSGRAGALGEVGPSVVAAAFVFFNPAWVAQAWERSGKVMSRKEAAESFLGCSSSWAGAHMQIGCDYERLSELLGAVTSAASPAGVVLFSAWRELEEPAEPAALALHRVNLLRELRGGLHGAAVVTSGIDPRIALMARTPQMAPVFGWEDPHPDPEPHREVWRSAEAATNRAMATSLSVLSPGELDELAELLDEAQSSVT